MDCSHVNSVIPSVQQVNNNMPIPAPKKGESSKKFVSSCMADSQMLKDYPDQKQRAAVCYSQLEKRSKASDNPIWEDNSKARILVLL